MAVNGKQMCRPYMLVWHKELHVGEGDVLFRSCDKLLQEHLAFT